MVALHNTRARTTAPDAPGRDGVTRRLVCVASADGPTARRANDNRVACSSMLLGQMPPDMRQRLLDTARVMVFDRGATVFTQGEPAQAIHLVLDGWVKLYRITPNGTEAVVSTFTRGRSFGEAAAIRNAPYPVSAEAVTDCRLLRLDAQVLQRMVRESPETALAMLSSTFAHLQSMVCEVEALKARNGAQRVAEFLLDLSDCPEDGPCEVTLPYDKLLVAGRLGMKPESLSRAFGKLKAQGVAVNRNAAHIADAAALRAFVEQDPAIAWARA